jgi:S1-C subfamily serine protease
MVKSISQFTDDTKDLVIGSENTPTPRSKSLHCNTNINSPTPVIANESNKSTSPGFQLLAGLSALISFLILFRFLVPQIIEESRYSWYRGELRARHEASGNGLKNVSLNTLSEAYQMLTQYVGPSVVHIDVMREDSSDDELRKFLNSIPVEKWGLVSDQGSGVVIDRSGYVVTNLHVIAGANEITVVLSDGKRCPGLVVGVDSLTDLALLKIDADRLIPINWGDSDECRVGTPVWAIGSPFGLDRTVTFGILSGKNRLVRTSSRYQDFMQSDAAINPGNSGGPLVNSSGQLIGINTAIVGDTFRGVSFSIPSNIVREVYGRLKTSGRFVRGWLGLSLEELISTDSNRNGAVVSSLVGADSPGAKAGILPGDIIRKIADEEIRNVGHLMRLAASMEIGSQTKLEIERSGKVLLVDIVVGKRPHDPD